MPVQIEANIDDMDPRLWPHVIDQLLSAGALDAWATPILMKKGRPAFTLGVLCEADAVEKLRALIFRETTTIGVRYFEVERQVLERRIDDVDVSGQSIAVKRASLTADRVVNTSIEWDDVISAAEGLGLSAKEVLAAAVAAARRSGPTPSD